MNRNDHIATWKLILIAGLAGRLAEILWIASYSSATAVDGGMVV